MMTLRINSVSLLLGLITISLIPKIALADTPGKHPFYLHARSDLRQAELLLQQADEPNVTRQEKSASNYVHQAIVEIDRASILDRKDVNNSPTIDTSLQHLNKFRSIYKLIRNAERDIHQEEDNHSVVWLRNSIQANIDQAKRYVESAASEDVIDDLRQNNY
ncbi:hypothetical protein [Nostoc sp. TCL26-01]|uniref:hypothetical protein n=1 Tax=Nostoc sp. TCL26-01 TaxID=2576904 RepID=UPI0015BD0FA2|nr:hypothetical protein [Nostoc sp. TCL26-01]QLE54596.1 hypothetical protein FD725_03150 [Nostoc sp. TCL26-01]